jgi:hypothetical protein
MIWANTENYKSAKKYKIRTGNNIIKEFSSPETNGAASK